MAQLRVKRLGSQQATVVALGQAEFLISYETPVAGYKPGMGYFRTSKFYSVTTSKHINQYLQGAAAMEVDPDWIQTEIDMHIIPF